MYFIWDSKNSKNPNSGKLSGWKPNDCVDFHFSISPYNRCHYITNLNQAFKFKSLTISHKSPLFNQPLDMRNKNIQLSLKHPLDIRTNLINPLIPYKSSMSPLTPTQPRGWVVTLKVSPHLHHHAMCKANRGICTSKTEKTSTSTNETNPAQPVFTKTIWNS